MKGLFSLEWEEITILLDHDWCGKKRFTEEVIYELNFEKTCVEWKSRELVQRFGGFEHIDWGGA